MLLLSEKKPILTTKHQLRLRSTLEKQAIKALIVDIRNFVKKRNLKVINPFPNLHTCFASDVARDMRDFTHFLQLLQSYTLLKLYQRPIITIGKQEYVVTTLEDVNAAKALFDEIAETTRTGTDKRVLDFYHRYVKKHVDGATLEIIAAAYNSDSQNRKNQLGDGTIRVWLKRLNRINWVQVKKGEVVSDKRKDTFYPLKDAETQVDAPELPSKVQTKFSETTLDSQIKTDSAVNLENSQETWLKTIGENEQLKSIVILKFGDENPIQLTVEQLKQIILGQTHANSLIVSEGKMDVKSENNDETVVKSEITPVSLNSDPCSKPVSNVSSTGSSDGGAS